MSKDVSFSLDARGGQDILTSMAAPVIRQSAEAIAARATSIASSMSNNPPNITIEAKVGIIKRGMRAIATIKAQGSNAHENYIGRMALTKAKDAGRVQ
jgi:hypothetical protein